MKIGLDFDGVIEDCGGLKSRGAKRLFGLDIPPAKLTKEIVERERFMTPKQYFDLQEFAYKDRQFGLTMKPVEGAFQTIARLIADGHAVTVVTSRIGIKLEIAREWSRKRGLQIDFIGVGMGGSKADALKGFDVYVDDEPSRVIELAGVVPHRFLLLWDYNSHLEVDALAKRVASWKELYGLIRTLKTSQ